MDAKKRKVNIHAHFPIEVWTNVFEFLLTPRSFYSLYFLNSHFHNYPWKSLLKNVEFKMKKNSAYTLGSCDLTYVSSLNLRALYLEELSDDLIKHLKGIPKLNLSECV